MKTYFLFICCLLTLVGYAQNGEYLDSIVVLNKDGIKIFTEIYQYDLYGQLIYESTREGGEHAYDYDHLGRLTQDLSTSAGGAKNRVDYQYDEAGNRTDFIFYWTNAGNEWLLIEKIENKYDDHHRLVSQTHFNMNYLPDLINGKILFKRILQYDDRGHTVLDMNYSPANDQWAELNGQQWEYDSMGRVVLHIKKGYIINIDRMITETSKTVYQYNETDTGKIITQSIFDWGEGDWEKTPSSIFETVYKDTDIGFTEERYRLIWNGMDMEKTLDIKSEHELDDFGNVLLEVQYILEEDKDTLTLWGKTERKYDNENRLIATRLYRPRENDVLALYVGQEITYTEKGNIAEKIDESYYTLDSKGKTYSIYYYSSLTSIPAIFNSLKVSIFPNPVSESFQISGLNGTAEVSVYDLNGRLLLQRKVVNSGVSIAINHLPSGIYTVQVRTMQERIERKILKE